MLCTGSLCQVIIYIVNDSASGRLKLRSRKLLKTFGLQNTLGHLDKTKKQNVDIYKLVSYHAVSVENLHHQSVVLPL